MLGAAAWWMPGSSPGMTRFVSVYVQQLVELPLQPAFDRLDRIVAELARRVRLRDDRRLPDVSISSPRPIHLSVRHCRA